MYYNTDQKKYTHWWDSNMIVVLITNGFFTGTEAHSTGGKTWVELKAR